MATERLPIYELEGELCRVLRDGRDVILQAPTGSGKSTQVPQILRRAGLLGEQQIVILQPRRLAARLLAARVAHELGGHLGEEVGYQIRLERVAGPQTKILFVTEGILLRRLLEDPELAGVGVIILDEFHERHLMGDLGLGCALRLQAASRPDLRLVVMSATLDGDALQRVLPQAVRLTSAGRTFPVEVEYASREPGDEPVWERAARALVGRFPVDGGHALIFMPGAYEIQRTVQSLRAELGGAVPIFPLHGEMAAAEQDAAVGESRDPKVIVATNVAETSLTIPGVTLVVDSGLARRAEFDPRRGINTLMVEKISRAAAEQRAGRAGRTQPGLCLRLWTLRDHERRAAAEEPEVRRLDLSETLLGLAAIGVTEVENFPWLDAPTPESLQRARVLLQDLGAIGTGGHLTALGRRLAAFPLHPRYARLLLEAEKWHCVPTAALLAALVQGRRILTRADRQVEAERSDLFGGSNSDFGFLLRAFRYAKRQSFRAEACRRLGIHAEACRQVERTAEQFLAMARRAGLDLREEPLTDEGLARCVLAGFADQVARRRHSGTGVYDLVHGRRGHLAKNSLAAEAAWIVVAEVAEIGQGSGEVRVELGLATAIELSWLREMFPESFSSEEQTFYDSSQKRVIRQRRVIFRDLVLEESSTDAPPGAETAACLAAEVRAGRIQPANWNETAPPWIERVNFLAQHCPELGFTPIRDEELQLLLEQFCEDATCVRDLKEKPALPVLQSWLRPEQVSLLEKLAPARLGLPGGKSCRIHYRVQGEARAAVRMQELFGVKNSLLVAGGKVPVTLEILAPNHRPVQVTNDLANFWRTTYPELRPALQRRYPKHLWLDDPTQPPGGAAVARKAAGSQR